jgi:erythromycin esterase
MNAYNQSKAEPNKVGFFGLDVYCLWESTQELMPYIQGNDSLIRMAQQVRQCFQPFSADPSEYSYAVANASSNCRQQTERLWQAIMIYTGGVTAIDEARFAMHQNALVAFNGENYLYKQLSGVMECTRPHHMAQTARRLLEFKGGDSKLIIWAHNTHVGDARYTDMEEDGMINLGQLMREEFGRTNVYAIGFGSYKGLRTNAVPVWKP